MYQSPSFFLTEETDSDLKVHALHYANELYLYASDFPFKNFCKLAKQTETIRNYQNRVWLWLSVVWETHKLTRYQSKEFSYITFLYRTGTKAYAYNYHEQILFIHSAKSKSFDHEKLTFSISLEHKSTYKSPGSRYLVFHTLFPAIAAKNLQENLATLTIWSRDVTTSTREPPTCA